MVFKNKVAINISDFIFIFAQGFTFRGPLKVLPKKNLTMYYSML